jgi:hypothetical protein
VPNSLATVTPNVMTLKNVHEVKRGARVGWRCTACSFVSESLGDAVKHTTSNQWTASPNLPPELQLSPEQEGA